MNVLFTYKTIFTWTRNPSYLSSILRTFFILPFTKSLKNIVILRYGLYTNNLVKSLALHTIQNLIEPTKTKLQPINLTSTYLQPIVITNFSFHKKTYNTLIVYILYLLTHLYINNFTNFNLWYSYIILPKHFFMLNFCNNYYFQLHHV